MEGLTAETCSLDGSRQTNYIQLLSLADGDSLTQPAFGNLTCTIAPSSALVSKPNGDSRIIASGGLPSYAGSNTMVVVVPSSAIVTSVSQAHLFLAPSTSVSAAAADTLDSTRSVNSATTDASSAASQFVDDRHYDSASERAGRRSVPGAPSFDTEAHLEAPNIPTTVSTAAPDQELRQRGKRKVTQRKERTHKGGWPKGKKRKRKHPRLSEPTAPATAYVLYSRERRPLLRIEYPESSNAEITRIIGNEWTRLSKIEKQKYSHRAEEDLARYKKELSDYQHSPEYQEFVRTKQAPPCIHSSDPSRVTMEPDDLGLHCADCDMYFISEHNKSEHFRSQKHLRMTVGEFEKYLTVKAPDRFVSGESASEINQTISDRANGRIHVLLDMEEAIAQVFQKHRENVLELTNLERYVGAIKLNLAAKKLELARLTARHDSMGRDLIQIKLQRVVCKQQLTNLRAIPMLFETEDYLA